MNSGPAELSFAIVLVLVLATYCVLGYPKNPVYGGKLNNNNNTGGTDQVTNSKPLVQNEIRTTTLRRKRQKSNFLKAITVIRCTKSSCSRKKRESNANKRRGVRIIYGNAAPDVYSQKRGELSSLASVLNVLDNKKTEISTLNRNGSTRAKGQSENGIGLSERYQTPKGSELIHNSISPWEHNFNKNLKQESLISLHNTKNKKISSSKSKAVTPILSNPWIGRIGNKSESEKLAISKPVEFQSNVLTAHVGQSKNRNKKRMNGIKSKDRPQLGTERHVWSPVKHPFGVPISYEDGPAIHVPAHLHQPPIVHNYGPGAIHLMMQPGGKSPPVPFIPGQEVSGVNGIEGQGNTGAFMGSVGAVHLNNLPFPQIHSFSPKVHHVPRPLPESDPSFIDSLTGPPIPQPPQFVPPMEGPPLISHPALVPSIDAPSTLDPPPLINHPPLATSIVAPSDLDTPMVAQNALEMPAFHGDMPSSQVVQQVPVPVPVERPPKRIPFPFPVPYPVHLPPQVKQIPVPVPVESPPKRIPFPVPYPVHLPPQVKHIPYPVPFPVRQPPEIHKIFYPIAFREPPQIKGIPVPVIVHPPPEVKSVPVPVRIPSPPKPVPVPVPSPPQVFVHRVPVPVFSPPVEVHHSVSESPAGGQCMVNPCVNGGSCTSFLETYRCHCPKGFKGRHCEEVSRCHPSPCKNFGSCTEVEGGFECTCAKGFTGKHCEVLDPCYPQPCKNGAKCWGVGDSYTCSCRVGWMGTNCEVESKCLPINPCQNGGTCSEQNGVYKCSCSLGWSGISCEISGAENQPQTTINIPGEQCTGCHANAYCRGGHCACRAGYHGDGYYCYQ